MGLVHCISQWTHMARGKGKPALLNGTLRAPIGQLLRLFCAGVARSTLAGDNEFDPQIPLSDRCLHAPGHLGLPGSRCGLVVLPADWTRPSTLGCPRYLATALLAAYLLCVLRIVWLARGHNCAALSNPTLTCFGDFAWESYRRSEGIEYKSKDILIPISKLQKQTPLGDARGASKRGPRDLKPEGQCGYMSPKTAKYLPRPLYSQYKTSTG